MNDDECGNFVLEMKRTVSGAGSVTADETAGHAETEKLVRANSTSFIVNHSAAFYAARRAVDARVVRCLCPSFVTAAPVHSRKSAGGLAW